MEKLFCNYEISKALQLLGFKEKCLATIDDTEYFHINGTRTNPRGAMCYDEIPCPLKSQVFTWFREIYNVDAWAQPFVNNLSLPDESYSYFIYLDGVWLNDSCDFLDFEEAESECIKEIIKLKHKWNHTEK